MGQEIKTIGDIFLVIYEIVEKLEKRVIQLEQRVLMLDGRLVGDGK